MSRAVVSACLLALVSVALRPAPTAGQQMPDPRQMSGLPLPAPDAPAGSVTVRVIRGSFANPVSSLTVELTGAGTARRAVTNDVGRAEFTGLAPGVRVTARATVGGERLESRAFEVPASGGMRLILAAADPASPAGGQPPPQPTQAGDAPPPTPGEVVLGDESRFVVEMGEDGLSVFYILEVVNGASTPVDPGRPIVFTLPADAKSASLLQGSSPQAAVAGRELKIAGPFPPGKTLVQLAYTMPISGSEVVIEQALPLALSHLAVVAQKVGEMQLESPQLAEQRTMPAQGNLYIAGRGGPVPAGQVVRFRFTGLPHHSTWPRNLALVLTALILAGGAWAAARPGTARAAADARRRQLERTREALFETLTSLESRHREGHVDPARYAARRRELMADLERVYAALDADTPARRAS